MKLTFYIDIKDMRPLVEIMRRVGIEFHSPEDATDFFYCMDMTALALLGSRNVSPELSAGFSEIVRDAIVEFRHRFKNEKPYHIQFDGSQLFEE